MTRGTPTPKSRRTPKSHRSDGFWHYSVCCTIPNNQPLKNRSLNRGIFVGALLVRSDYPLFCYYFLIY
ncbi:unnamed protein product [Meloidogyne enterolobii]|uniref:Uncharacterized protein n=1 Tax=Meloidogyne enterolobii TaxID=390850 RepID=A0ACB0YZR0_MELEN